MITYAGVDWVTMTSREDKVGMEWYSMYGRYRREKLLEANKEEPFNNGFYAGIGIASMRWGYSDHLGYILIISGSDAERFWQNLEPGTHRVTRLDICVDFWPKKPSLLARDLYDRVTPERLAEFPKLSLFRGPNGGDTLYVGSRHSQQYGRLYDKGVESRRGEPGQYWRAEVEYKKPLAGLMAQELIQENSAERRPAIIDTVAHWFIDRGIEALSDDAGKQPIKMTVEQRITTADRKLAWLQTQVRPTIQRLVSLGLGRDVMKSLLLDEETLVRIFASANVDNSE